MPTYKNAAFEKKHLEALKDQSEKLRKIAASFLDQPDIVKQNKDGQSPNRGESPMGRRVSDKSR